MVVDIGCGDASVLRIIAGRFGLNKIQGVDFSDLALAKAADAGVRVHKVDLNTERLPFADNSIDLVLMEEIIEHLVNPDNAISEVYRILKDGGYLLLTTPNLGWWCNRLALLLGYQPYWTECSTVYNVGKFGRPDDEPLSGHLRLYTLRAVTQLLRLHRFRLVAVKGITYDNLPLILKQVDKGLTKAAGLGQIIVLLGRK